MLDLEDAFPALRYARYGVTSEATIEYNCIAWAAGSTDACWWPDRAGQYYWPDDIPREEALNSFRQLFESRGYEVCDSHSLEPDYEKVAVYTDPSGRPTHAARQLPDGMWTSKLGQDVDISHQTLAGIRGSRYGVPTLVLKRRRTE
jgi:hypothetical protein